MKTINIILFISFYLEAITTNFININTHFFNPLFSFITIIFIYPLFNNNYKYYKTCFIYGFIYDLVYTDTIFMHAIIFLLIGILISKSLNYFSNNIINLVLITLISLIIYRLVNYILICIVSEYTFKIRELLNSITSSILINSIYSVILYLVLKKKYKNITYSNKLI